MLPESRKVGSWHTTPHTLPTTCVYMFSIQILYGHSFFRIAVSIKDSSYQHFTNTQQNEGSAAYF
jgi:hypothetical protein